MDVCAQVKSISESLPYKAVVSLKLIVALLSVLLFIAHATLKGTRRVYHPNTRTIYLFICLSTVGSAVNYVILHGYDLHRLSIHVSDPCDRLAWAALILFLRLLSVIFVCCIDSAILFLCVERVYCTLRIRRYEESSRTTLLAALCVLATASWSIAYYLLLSPGVQWEERIAVATLQNPQNAGGYKIMLLSVLVIEPASLAFIVLIRVWNQRVRQRIRSEFIDTTRYERLLSMKFQTEETIRVTSMFIPIVATKVFFTAFSAVSIFIANNLVAYQQADLSTKMFLYEAFQQNYLQSVVMPLFLMYKTDQLSRLFPTPRVTPREYVRGSVVLDNFEAHFTRLQLIFEGDIPSHTQPSCKGCFLS